MLRSTQERMMQHMETRKLLQLKPKRRSLMISQSRCHWECIDICKIQIMLLNYLKGKATTKQYDYAIAHPKECNIVLDLTSARHPQIKRAQHLCQCVCAQGHGQMLTKAMALWS